MLQTEAEPRVRKRLSCMLSMEARRHNGLILNLSPRGLFVQTTLPAEPGTLLDLDVRDPVRGEAIPLQAAVVWRRRVSPRMTGVNQSGMGLRLIHRPPAWQAMMSGLLEDAPETGSPRPEADTKCADSAEPAGEPPAPCYFVRLAEAGGPRSRRLLVQADTEDAACREALQRVGEGWTVLEIALR